MPLSPMDVIRIVIPNTSHEVVLGWFNTRIPITENDGIVFKPDSRGARSASLKVTDLTGGPFGYIYLREERDDETIIDFDLGSIAPMEIVLFLQEKGIEMLLFKGDGEGGLVKGN